MPTFGTSGSTFGGFAVDRSVFRRLLPDYKWYLYAAGLVSAGDTNTATIKLIYVEDTTGTTHDLGSVTHNTASVVKKALGPIDLFAAAGVPNDEDVVVVRLYAEKDAGVDGTVDTWTVWLRLLPSQQ